ncbi:hypothetical protein OEZ86_011959 [Tetradesmus obliquus]|nr:hypothetical protein OEZ86_011959 [Tetradesmus obliquus]
MDAKMMTILLLLAWLGCASAADPMTTVREQGLTLFEGLAKLAGAQSALSKPNARITVLAPTNEAIKAFLKEMGIDLRFLDQHEALADEVLAYHVIVGKGANELLDKGYKSIRALTASGFTVNITQTKDGWQVNDHQGNTAKVVKASIKRGNHTIHVVDRVLMSGAYWTSLSKLTARQPALASSFQAALSKAGAASTLGATSSLNTLFVPNDAAFKAAGPAVASADAKQVAAVLSYHVIPGKDLTIPSHFKEGQPEKTQSGRTVSMKYTQEAGKTASGRARTSAVVTLSDGTSAKVLVPNMFIGKTEAHIIDAVLLPKAAAPTKAATPSGAPTKAAATPAPAKPAAAPAKVEAGAVKAAAGRKLMKAPGADNRDSYDFTQAAELNAEEQDIMYAVDDHANTKVDQMVAGSDAIANADQAEQFPSTDAPFAAARPEASTGGMLAP